MSEELVPIIEYYKNLDLEDITYFCEIDNKWKFEQWEDVVGYENIYQVSDLGRIKSLLRKVAHSTKGKTRTVNTRIFKQGTDSDGYLNCLLSFNGISITHKSHRLVATAFIPNPYNKPEVNHKKGIKNDNRVSQLEWSTQSENGKHAYKIGLNISKKGHKSYLAKLTESDVVEIKFLSGFIFQYEIAKIFNVSTGAISMLLNNITYNQ